MIKCGLELSVSGFQKRICYDCEMCLPFIEECDKSQTNMLFHFADRTHFAFDSMLYAGGEKALVFFQITIDESHRISYREIKELIKGIPVQPAVTVSEKDKKKNNPKKYQRFFNKVKNFVGIYYFQWLTNKKYTKLIERSKELKEEEKNFRIYTFDENLISQINSA